MAKFPGWLRYGFPSLCFGLGTWQLYRLQWKKRVISELEGGLQKSSVKLEAIPEDVEAIRYRRLRLYGDPDLTGMPIFLGPRGALDIDHNFAMQFIVPFRLADGTRVLVDYGRVPLGEERTINIPINQQYVEAMVERPEKKSFSVGGNDAEAGKWRYRDVEAMAKHLGTEPLLFKRVVRRINPDDIPIASLPKIDVPNRHLEYVFTWYIMAGTTYMLGFLKK